MGQLRLGATKKSKRKAGPSPSLGNSKKSNSEPAPSKPAIKAKPSKPRNKGSKRTAVEVIRNDERDISDQDIEDFDEYSHFQGFLQHLDPQALAQKVKKQARSHVEKPRLPASERTLSRKAIQTGDTDDIDSVSLSEDDLESQESLEAGSEDVISLDGDESEAADVQDHDIDLSSEQSADEEPDYEARPRAFLQQAIESDRLPIKLSDGRIQKVHVPPKSKPAIVKEPVQLFSEEEEDESEAELEEETKVSAKERLLMTQERLARLASEIIENPEENIELLSKIKEIYRQTSSIERHYAILTMSAVFKDIIPGYRIRPLTDIEKNEKVTKEIRALRNFEQTLVLQYQDFVKTLTSLTKTSRKADAEHMMSEHKSIAITAACSLLSSAPHFNFRIELLSILINQIVKKNTDSIFIQCRATIEELFQEDQEGEASFEAMRLLCKKMKDRDYQVDQSTIGTFLHLRLLTEMEARGSTTRVEREKLRKKDRQFRTKKLKKLLKEQKEVEKDMREAEATVNSETRERLQGEVLKLAFTTYFRILKERSKLVMGAALEGLAKFAHLINVDFFGDLLEVLKELMKEDPTALDALTTRETLLCIVTAFTLLSGQGSTKETVNLDLSKFMDQLYSTLLTLSMNLGIELNENTHHSVDQLSATPATKSKINVGTEAEMLLRALDAIFFKHRVQGSLRLTAFVKRLSTASLHFPEKTAAAALELTKRLVTRYGRLYSLYSTEDTARDGTYNGETDNLELANPAATTVWELALYTTHYSPKMRDGASELVTTLRESSSNVRT